MAHGLDERQARAASSKPGMIRKTGEAWRDMHKHGKMITVFVALGATASGVGTHLVDRHYEQQSLAAAYSAPAIGHILVTEGITRWNDIHVAGNGKVVVSEIVTATDPKNPSVIDFYYDPNTHHLALMDESGMPVPGTEMSNGAQEKAVLGALSVHRPAVSGSQKH